MAITGVDWEAGEEHFITQTGPTVSLRQYAVMTPKYAWTAGQALDHQKIKDIAKKNLWLKKRAKWLFENRPGLTTNVEAVYSLIMTALVDFDDDLSPTDLSNLSRQFLELHRMMLSQRLVDVDEDTEAVTRDQVIDISRTTPIQEANELLEKALEDLEGA